MADKKSVGHAYNVDFLNVVFAASSLFLFLSVIWMVWDDFDREWKKKQREFAQLETQDGGPPDLHLAVIDTDMGADGVPGCNASHHGERENTAE